MQQTTTHTEQANATCHMIYTAHKNYIAHTHNTNMLTCDWPAQDTPVLQAVDSVPEPGHCPLLAGAGLLHGLVLALVPEPHVTEHDPQLPQLFQPPLTGENYVLLKSLIYSVFIWWSIF